AVHHRFSTFTKKDRSISCGGVSVVVTLLETRYLSPDVAVVANRRNSVSRPPASMDSLSLVRAVTPFCLMAVIVQTWLLIWTAVGKASQSISMTRLSLGSMVSISPVYIV